jgi:hypothetical protein
MEGVGRQNWARGRIPIFRKIHLYGKSVKSTHGHTKKKPTQPFFSDLAIFRPPRLPYTKAPTLHLPYAYPTPRHLPYSRLPYTKAPTLHLPYTKAPTLC